MRRISEQAKRDASVAASDSGDDPDGGRLPRGEVHGWWHGQAETVCGLMVRRSDLATFPALSWADVQPASGGAADLVQQVCPRCRQALAPARPPGRHPR